MTHKNQLKEKENELTPSDGIQTLMDLGLNASQGQVYLALLKLPGNSKATTIAKFSKVARQDVYRLLAELQQLGLVEKIIAKPARFRPIPPKDAVAILLRRKMVSYSGLQKKAKAFAETAAKNFVQSGVQPERDQFVLITEREAVALKVKETFENSRKSVDCITPFKELAPWLTILTGGVDEALRKGVRIRWITEKPEGEEGLIENLHASAKNPKFDLRYAVHRPKVKLGIHDDRETIIGIFAGDNFAQSPALWSNNPALVALADSYFETCWKTGIDAKSKFG